MKKAGVIVLIIAVLGLIGWGIYYYYKNSASASTQKVNGVTFQLLSSEKLTLQKVSANNYKIEQPIGVSGGFGLRVMGKRVEFDRSSGEGLIYFDSIKKTVGVYPLTAGPHQISFTSDKRSVTLQFSTSGYQQNLNQISTPTPYSTPTPNSNSTISSTPTPNSNSIISSTPTPLPTQRR